MLAGAGGLIQTRGWMAGLRGASGHEKGGGLSRRPSSVTVFSDQNVFDRLRKKVRPNRSYWLSITELPCRK